jgi:beta-glucosidase
MTEEQVASWRNADLPAAARAEALAAALTLEEKLAQLTSRGRIERLGIAAMPLGGECIHGLARRGRTTVFPQALGLAATWNVPLISRVAGAISDEIRAAFHDALRRGRPHAAPGLACWGPNINLLRDPRWGRGQETYGEDPYLTARMAVAFIRAMQGDDPRCVKVACAVKHYAVHSGPEAVRHEFDARVGPKDLHETYLPHFEAAIREGRAAGVMGAYNRVNGEPCCASPMLLRRILREQWGFEGFVVSDGGALRDLHDGHGATRDEVESAALALKSGCDLCLGREYRRLPEAIRRGLVREGDVDRAALRLLTVRFRLGLFDPPEGAPYASIPIDVVDGRAHRELALEAARESIVLLRNAGDLLPLPGDLRSIAVVGPNAADVEALLGNYSGLSGRMVTPLEGIAAAAGCGTRVRYERGCDVSGDDRRGIAWAARQAARADVIVAVFGLSPSLEGEEYDAPLADAVGDRVVLALPGVQQDLLEALVATGRPVVLVLTGCGPLAVNRAAENVPAIVHLGYAGEEGGTALAEVLFGEVSPSGRLAVTWPKSADQLPPFHDYTMARRTYRYMTDEPLFPFGYGLSYTQFSYSDLRLEACSLAAGEELKLRASVTNTGGRAGGEVVQAYLSDLEASVPVPLRQLVGFRKCHLESGESRQVSFTVTPRQMSVVDDAGRRVQEPGRFRVTVGGHQGDALSTRLTGRPVLSVEFDVRA